MNDDLNEIIDNEQAEEGSELYEHIRMTVDPGQQPERIDTYLTNHLSNISRNRVQNAAKAGNILVNEKAVKQNYKVKPGDTISIVFTYPPRDADIKPEDIPLNIVYEDDDVIVINKQAGLVVHPGHGNFEHTLLHGLAYHFEQTHQNIENRFGYLVHRIDKDTTGLMIVAKNEAAQAVLAHQFFEHTIHRRYYALVWGDFDEEEGTIEGNIGRSVNDRRKMTVYPNGDYGKDAITHWRVLERFGYVTLNEYRLETGRTHQIRVHLSSRGHALVGDKVYVKSKKTELMLPEPLKSEVNHFARQALHAKSLGFEHPRSGQWLQFDSQLPADMQNLLALLADN